MKTKHVFMNTIGCQMNVYDTRRMLAGLAGIGYQPTPFMETADLIIVNTCSVRAKAEQKAFSFIGRAALLKKNNPDLIIGVGGCVAQQEGKTILKRVPAVDIVFGTHAVGRLPLRITEIESNRQRVVDVETAEAIEPIAPSHPPEAESPVSGFVTIMRGCDNFCTYCIVPYVRGREISRNPDEILQEVSSYAASGMREVTLLGQNVNSYGKKESLCSFSELLEKVNQVEGLRRIRFTTSHPKDLSDELVACFGRLEKLCHHIHLPVQSGSNKILKKMNRRYTRELYLEKIAKLRDTCPDIAVTSDMIVGFPGETEPDFKDTLDLVQQVEFDGLFAFTYSDRPHAPAVQFAKKVSETDKKKRLQELLNLQEHYTRSKNQALVGQQVTILVEGLSKKQPGTDGAKSPDENQWTGRTSTNKIVNFIWKKEKDCPEALRSGMFLNIRIEKALSHSLWGQPIKTVKLG